MHPFKGVVLLMGIDAIHIFDICVIKFEQFEDGADPLFGLTHGEGGDKFVFIFIDIFVVCVLSDLVD